MAPYFPLYLNRSDGRLETISLKSKKKESNAPNESQLNAKREVNGNRDYYKPIEVGDAKEVDWRRKLGGMLMKEIGEKEHSGKKKLIITSKIKILMWPRAKVHSGGFAGELPAVRTCKSYES